jgi:hypothetical protein
VLVGKILSFSNFFPLERRAEGDFSLCSGVQEDLHSGLDLMIMYAKPHQMTLSLRNEELSLRNMLLYIDSM